MAPTCALPVDVPTFPPPGALENEPWFMFIPPMALIGSTPYGAFCFDRIGFADIGFVDCSCCIVGFRRSSSVAGIVAAAADFSAAACDHHWRNHLAAVAAVLAPFFVRLVAKKTPPHPFATTAERRRRRLVAAGSARPRRWWRLPPLEALAPRRPRRLLEIHLALNQNQTTTRPLQNR